MFDSWYDAMKDKEISTALNAMRKVNFERTIKSTLHESDKAKPLLLDMLSILKDDAKKFQLEYLPFYHV